MLRFRNIELADHQGIADWASDEESQKWLAGIGSKDWLNQVQNDPKDVVLIALVADKAVGMVQGEFAADGKVSIAMVLDPNLRAKRYGRMILKEAIQHPRFGKAKGFSVHIDQRNAASMKCFVSAGFKPTGGPDSDGLVGLSCSPSVPHAA